MSQARLRTGPAKAKTKLRHVGPRHSLDDESSQVISAQELENLHRLDLIDWKILATLQQNARIRNIELSKIVHLSPSPCLARVRSLEQEGFIQRYVTLLNAPSVGFGANVFVQVRLEKQIDSALNEFEKVIAGRPEIMECYLMTGDADYLLRVVVSDLESYQTLLTELAALIPNVEIQSNIALKQVKYKTALPIQNEPQDR